MVIVNVDYDTGYSEIVCKYNTIQYRKIECQSERTDSGCNAKFRHEQMFHFEMYRIIRNTSLPLCMCEQSHSGTMFFISYIQNLILL